jgi:redox-sensitive bicupin YhaK (pirin superfamily)
MDRRAALTALVSTPLAAACKSDAPPASASPLAREEAIQLVTAVEPLGTQWKTPDPFLFCVHHDDAYPAGNGSLGPAVSLAGRPLGSDFSRQDGFSMYHGEVVPGFPQHPHRGFETVTVVRRGLVDHSDSLGAAARYGNGDVQWLTAGKGIVHAEMFPLLDASAPNPLELFQIWLNLPARDKFVEPHFSMLWRDAIPRRITKDARGRSTELTVVAGAFEDLRPPSPPPHSYGSRPDSGITIWTLKLEPNAEFSLPAAAPGTLRMLYFFRGTSLLVGGREVVSGNSIEVKADARLRLENGSKESELLILGGRPIGEPVVQRGPFVMNTQAEIQKAFSDFRATHFGGWPWPRNDPVHGEKPERFARHADGRTERA